MARPLALTLGEPAGIGPDITLTAWLRRREGGGAALSAVGAVLVALLGRAAASPTSGPVVR